MASKVGFFFLLALIAVGVSCAPVDQPKKVAIKDADKEAPPPPVEVPKELKERLQSTLKHVHARQMDTTFNFWTIFHGILGTGLEMTLVEDHETGKVVNAIDYICKGGKLNGLRFVPQGKEGEDGVDVQLGPVPDGQGHQDQFVAEMIQWGLPADRKFLIDRKEYTFQDFIRFSKARASATRLDTVSYGKARGSRPKGQELSWAILVIAHAYGVDTPPWENRYGEKVTLEDLIRAELQIDNLKAACGGTHSLFGLAWVYHLHLQKGGKDEGIWAEVRKHLDHSKELARKNQNEDGSFPMEYQNAKGPILDPREKEQKQDRINTAGHVVEWLALYLTDEELRAPWMQDAVMSLCKSILDSSHDEIKGGALYHATHGLHIYHDRVFGPFSPTNRPLIPLPPKK